VNSSVSAPGPSTSTSKCTKGRAALVSSSVSFQDEQVNSIPIQIGDAVEIKEESKSATTSTSTAEQL
jgi:hypothetical protein